MISGQESILFLQSVHQIRELLHNTLVGAEILLFRQHHTEVEDELVAVIAERLHTDRVAQDTVAIGANLNQVSAKFLPRDHEEGDVGEGQEGGLRGRGGGGNDSTVWDLVDDLRT